MKLAAPLFDQRQLMKIARLF